MSDNSFSTGYGPSTPGALNLVAGNTFGAICATGETFKAPTCPTTLPAGSTQQGPGTVTGDPQPLTALDQCGAKLDKVPTGPTGPQQARCGYGPRQPLLLISPFARRNFVDHSLTDQSSILRFIEDNWDLGRIGNGSVDKVAGPLNGMFDFAHPSEGRLILDAQGGQPAAGESGPSED